MRERKLRHFKSWLRINAKTYGANEKIKLADQLAFVRFFPLKDSKCYHALLIKDNT